MIYDLIVVGSGSVGAAAGYYATQAGLSVLMIDSAHPPHNQGTHHGESRLIRHAYGEGERYVPLVLRAQTLWDELEQRAGERIMHRSGVLNLAPTHSPFIRNVIDSASRWQLNIEVMQPDQVRKRWPQINVPEGYLGVFEPQSGFLKCEQAVRSWIQLAEQAGCAQLFNCPVSEIGRDGDLQQVTTLDGIYRGRKMLISAGTWVGKLIPGLPVAPTRKVFAWYQADGRYSENNKFPGFTVEMADGSQFYGFPADNNALKVGRHDGGQLMQQPEDRKPFGAVAADGSETFSFLRQFLPGVGVCLHGEACSYDFSPDEDFIIDTLPGEPDRLLITGLSGHGFKFASVLGELAAEFAQQKPFSFDLSPFRLSRF
ncbi:MULTISPECIES: N-methyl-L-tryptophan oxidase [unclassified Pantoea]|uniref:N-methyl-L-tryptophan oxidase n=1 Tax=unclassified Pantoea TaxID=2630326 RepID=UPI00247737AA|nr:MULTISPECIES: N-methyl-L-tryptophan oxidase [unclassified Pantoea]GME32983.1 N-methyl-L-tryptophan oxidase [Pantoea sp. QMID3]GME33280.1 N-methyl-L-tryptophan oxidase [Pantoea sp. QMID1]GME56233.1 N-methyl-L-tryptophan oxidase [Pantoea sp. QMID4]GME57369.1 N-methyl-L-tryptophan oxidase [Pantoea sp. QMID2]